MKLRDLLKIESVVDKRAVPSDMIELDIEYFSESKQQNIDIMDMHLVHFIRVFVKMQNAEMMTVDEIIEKCQPITVNIDGVEYVRLNEKIMEDYKNA